MDITEQERELIEIIRDNSAADFRLLIEFQDGAWNVEMTVLPNSHKRLKKAMARGVGASFSGAWENMAPTWA
jgi:hypothetical protein